MDEEQGSKEIKKSISFSIEERNLLLSTES